MRIKSLLFVTLFATATAHAATYDGDIAAWKKGDNAKFSNPQATFNDVMKIVREHYSDPSVTDEDLYRAATAGLLAGLNTGDEKWNKLYSPRELEDLEIELSGKLAGIGATLSWDAETGHAKVENVIPGSGSLKAGLEKGDEVLSVNGQKFKGKTLSDMVAVLRGPEGGSVSLKVLRDVDVRTVKITRSIVHLDDCIARKIDDSTGLLHITMFTKQTPEHVRAKLDEFRGMKKLIVDLRDNSGGGFDQALAVAELFAAKGTVLAKTRDRGGKIEEYRGKDSAWSPDTRLVVLIDKQTFSGAELLAASLQENRKALLVGTATHGKWSVQSVETLPNKFAIKYSVLQFQSPSGASYQGVGLKPNFEVTAPKDGINIVYWNTISIRDMIEQDPQLKAAVAL